MKKALLLTITLLSFVYSFSQNTTETEYLYMTKGLKIQKESGLDVKKGYTLEPLVDIKESIYTFNFSMLVKNDEPRFSGIVVIARAGGLNSKNIYYKAIPSQSQDFNNESELMKAFKNDYKTQWSASLKSAYAIAVSKYMSYTFMNLYKSVKKQESQISK